MDPEGTTTEVLEPPEALAPDVEGSVQDESRPITVEEAWDRAQAQATASIADEESQGAPPGEPEGKPAAEIKPDAPATVAPEVSAQQELDRIITLWKQGRVRELTPQQRGTLQRFQSDVRETTRAGDQAEQTFREHYLSLLALEAESPEDFAKLLRSDELLPDGRKKGKSTLDFMDLYHQEHPEVTLESPEAPTLRRGDVRKDALAEAFGHVDDAILAAAQKHGLAESDLAESYQKSGNDFAGYLAAIVDKAVEKAVERERPKIAEAERKAARLEEQARWSKNNIVTPRPISGRPAGDAASTQRGRQPAPDSIEAAAQRVLERQAAAS